MNTDANSFLPLSPVTLHILLALASEDLHGYAIKLEIARQSGGRYKIGPGTLYDNIKKLLDLGLVKESGKRAADDDPRRRYYRLTTEGRAVLSSEISRLEGVVQEAKLRLQGPRPRRA